MSGAACRHPRLERMLGQVWLGGCSVDQLLSLAAGDGFPACALSRFPALSDLVCGGTCRKMS